MSRRRRATHRPTVPDVRYNSALVTHLINVIMKSGKKTTAERIVYGALEELKEKTGQDPIEVMDTAIANMKPKVEVKSRRVGGTTYPVPVEIRPIRRMALAMRWLREAAKKRGEKSMGQRLANEMLEASENRGGAVKKRDEVHRMAEANKAFAHFRF